MGPRRLLGDVVSWKIAGIALAVICLIVGGVVLARRASGPPVSVTLRIAVTPTEQTKLVREYASGARFKYLIGKQADVKPVLAQKLVVKVAPNSSEIEAAIRVETKAQGERYADAFAETLQGACGGEARVSLVSRAIR